MDDHIENTRLSPIFDQNRITGSGLSAPEFVEFYQISRICNDNSNKYKLIFFLNFKFMMIL